MSTMVVLILGVLVITLPPLPLSTMSTVCATLTAFGTIVTIGLGNALESSNGATET